MHEGGRLRLARGTHQPHQPRSPEQKALWPAGMPSPGPNRKVADLEAGLYTALVWGYCLLRSAM